MILQQANHIIKHCRGQHGRGLNNNSNDSDGDGDGIEKWCGWNEGGNGSLFLPDSIKESVCNVFVAELCMAGP